MNKYLKAFLHRGLIFGGFGPIIIGIVYAILDSTVQEFSLGGWQVLIAIVSSYFLAFIQAGASVFNQMERWPIAKSLVCHFALIYAAYLCCYILNTWIPFEPMVVVIFSAIFVVAYLVIWLAVYFTVKATEKRLNRRVGG